MKPEDKDTRDICRFHEYCEKATELMDLLAEVCNLDKNKFRPNVGSTYTLYLIRKKSSIIEAYEFIDSSLEKLKMFRDAGISFTESDIKECLNTMTKGE